MEPLTRVTPAMLRVLEVLLGPDEELYGLKIAQAAGLKTGSVYPILARLEDAGWLESFWESAERGDRGPRRRFYRFNPDGITAAREVLAERSGDERRPSRRRPRPLATFLPPMETWQ
jgi:PadR family transcriptional regulator, regulatory protein PadR